MKISVVAVKSMFIHSTACLIDLSLTFPPGPPTGQVAEYFRSSSLSSKKTSKGSPKKVDFQEGITVVLIPARQEYVQADLADVLWWNPQDFHEFKLNARHERKMLRTRTPPAATLSSSSGQLLSTC